MFQFFALISDRTYSHIQLLQSVNSIGCNCERRGLTIHGKQYIMYNIKNSCLHSFFHNVIRRNRQFSTVNLTASKLCRSLCIESSVFHSICARPTELPLVCRHHIAFSWMVAISIDYSRYMRMWTKPSQTLIGIMWVIRFAEGWWIWSMKWSFS